MSVPRDRAPGRELTPRRRRQLEDERRRLLQAVVDGVATVGLDEVTVHGICEAADVSARRGFYRHFPDVRTAFVEACLEIDRALRDVAAAALRASVDLEPRERVQACVAEIVGFLIADPVRAEALLVHGHAGGPEIAQAREATMTRFAEHLRELTARMDEPAAAQDELVVRMALGGAHETIHREIVAGALDRLPEQVSRLTDLLLLPSSPRGTRAGGGADRG
jgi:AcrR family transcriptional regulator